MIGFNKLKEINYSEEYKVNVDMSKYNKIRIDNRYVNTPHVETVVSLTKSGAMK